MTDYYFRLRLQLVYILRYLSGLTTPCLSCHHYTTRFVDIGEEFISGGPGGESGASTKYESRVTFRALVFALAFLRYRGKVAAMVAASANRSELGTPSTQDASVGGCAEAFAGT